MRFRLRSLLSLLTAVSVSIICTVSPLIPKAYAAPAPESNISVSAKSAILIDQTTGTVLYEKNADEQMPPASITKIMTMLLVMEALDSGKIALTDPVTGSENAASMGGTQIWLEVGETFSVDEMLKACAIASANDASMALAEFVGGSESGFVSMMNEKAKLLGMKNTTFINPTGLDAPGHVSSARDIAIMSRELLKYPLITNYTTVWMDSLRDGQMGLVNTNKLVRFYNGCTGLKTGTTDGAGSCLSASATRDGLSLIAVVMGCKTSKERFADARTLLDYGFASFEQYTPALPEDLPQSIPVTGGMQLSVKIKSLSTDGVLLKKGESSSVTVDVTYAQAAEASIGAGDELGSVIYKLNGTVICQIPLVAAEDVEALGFVNAFEDLFLSLWK